MRPSPRPANCIFARRAALRGHDGTTPPLARAFATTPSRPVTLQRRRMFEWLNGVGKVFRNPLPGSTNYLNAYTPDGKLVRLMRPNEDKGAQDEADEGDSNLASGRSIPRERSEDLRVFPDNIHFRSEAVLSEPLKQAIYEDVTRRDVTVREASVKHQVDIRRVGAVVRLKAMEAAWVESGKPLANPYARAILAMLPQTKLGRAHEPLNDLPVHSATTRQIFHPVAESRQFTRADAGRVFQRDLLPADARIPHPQMVRAARTDDAAGVPSNARDRQALLRQEMRTADAAQAERATRRERRRGERTTRVAGKRAEWCFEDVTVNKEGTGMWVSGIGSRYGVPHQDRKKGEVKIPRRVE